MSSHLSDYFHDEKWQQLRTDLDELKRELVEQRDSPSAFGDFKHRLLRVKLGHLDLQLEELQQSLHQQMERFAERLLANFGDQEAHELTALGMERLAEMQRTTRLLHQLAADAGGPNLALTEGVVLAEAPSISSSQAAEPLQSC